MIDGHEKLVGTGEGR